MSGDHNMRGQCSSCGGFCGKKCQRSDVDQRFEVAQQSWADDIKELAVQKYRPGGLTLETPLPAGGQRVALTDEQMKTCREAALEEAARVCESAITSIWDYHDDKQKQIGTTVCNNLAANIRKLKEPT